MRRPPRRRSYALAVALLAAPTFTSPLAALPTMIRLGYADCAACHISPQGGGLLNDYGRGIDQAQSLRGGEYAVRTDGWARAFSLGGRVTQDFRLLIPLQDTRSSGQVDTAFRLRVMYRNVTAVSRRLRFAGTITAETESDPHPARPYDPAPRAAAVFVNTGLVHFRVNNAIEIAAGRDQLPVGISGSDPTLYLRSRSRLGTYNVPAQVKVFVSAPRFQLMPFVYRGSSGMESAGERDWGAGTGAELDLVGRGNPVIGATYLRGAADNGDRRTLTVYTRLGFGSWGMLGERGLTTRTRTAPSDATFTQSATYAQVFWAIREWLVASATGERLRVEQPFEERLDAAKVAVTARLSSQATIGVSARIEHDALSGRRTRTVSLQGAFKTVP